MRRYRRLDNMSSCGLWNETLAIAEDYIGLCLTADPSEAPLPPSEAAASMRRMGRHAESLYEATFQNLVQTFVRGCWPDLCSGLRSVMQEMVNDGFLNWGRVVSVFAFTGVLARRLLEDNEEEETTTITKLRLDLNDWPQICRKLAETIADFLIEEKKEWMLENNGWEGFCKWCSSRQSSQDASMKTALLAAAGVGLAGLTFLLAR
ncbi:bcl-2-like protein 10 isoform X1 [Hippocampus zosterae]|uniref:bcl-2-like protein 10 isoform X1 n=2 Tax=Hippocampus zosterae TaxID=109293 RepID=UPI00223DF703|nr:bcl-2-like protein 10 isoform X1 [Hippocampus zosterae]